jgi:hypothetical protein
MDGDGDGVPAAGSVTMLSSDGDCDDLGEATASDVYDCNDADATIYPGAPEVVVDGIDQDCDGGDACFADADGDGFRDATGATVFSEDDDCLDPGEATADAPATDCDDTDATVNPDAFEYVADGKDSDCNGYELCYTDEDGDGYRPMTGATTFSADLTCDGEGEAPPAMPPTDCNDFDPLVRPDATEVVGDGIDSNCDGQELCYVDTDGDGYAAGDLTITSGDADCRSVGEATSDMPRTDCDDENAAIHPGATEVVADGIDSDCDGQELCLADLDDDGYTDMTGATVGSDDDDCDDSGEGLESDPATDCDDTTALVYPGTEEIPADGTDSDCDGTELCYVDTDGDGYAAGDLTITSEDNDCGSVGEATADVPRTDCDDDDAATHPDATEVVGDGTDSDCDGIELCYVDNDSDGYAAGDLTVASADADCGSEGEATSDEPRTDCDDENAAIHPDATEVVADGTDSDCDGTELCYVDNDSDGYAAGDLTITSEDDDCASEGEATADMPRTDCDDDNADVHPDATEVMADGVDQDCDGVELCYVDNDGDGYAAGDLTITSEDDDCESEGEATADMPRTDCDDENVDIHPDATEVIADGIDQDCDGQELCLADLDDDGYTDMTGATVGSDDDDCDDPGEGLESEPATDCDDTTALAHPGAEEIPADGTDQDCDGMETCYIDEDGDGHAETTGMVMLSNTLDCSDEDAAPIGAPMDDCDDGTVSVYPGATEAIADGVDQDCDGGELCYIDADEDGARSADGATVASEDMACTDAGEATGLASADCNDADASIHPGAEESAADGIDSNCDGAELCYTDYDGDGYRPDDFTPVDGDLLCTGSGLVGGDAPAGDCDDDDASVNPEGTEEVADGTDSNCDGIELCYVDSDGDGFRTMDEATVETEIIDCDGDGLAGADAPPRDCDDSLSEVNPSRTEFVGDEIDSDCDGVELCYQDLDEDGYRTAETIASSDSDCADPGEASGDAPLVDCDDTRAGVYPGAEEIVGDGVDQDCNGTDPAPEEEPVVVDTGDVDPADDGTADDGTTDDDDDDDEPSDSETDEDIPIEVTVEMDAPKTTSEKGGCSTLPRGVNGLTWLLSFALLIGVRREN